MSHIGYPPGWGKLTDTLKEETRNICQLCGDFVPEKLSHTFQSHHLDHNRNNIYSDNLLPACQRCHERLQKIKITMGKAAFLAELAKAKANFNYQATIF